MYQTYKFWAEIDKGLNTTDRHQQHLILFAESEYFSKHNQIRSKLLRFEKRTTDCPIIC